MVLQVFEMKTTKPLGNYFTENTRQYFFRLFPMCLIMAMVGAEH